MPNSGTGIALRWKIVKKVSIAFPGKLERIGWCRLSTNKLDSDIADLTFEEGSRDLRKHIRIERNAKLRAKSKSYWRTKLGGRLYCCVCNFDFEKRYGPHGSDFIEMHHLKNLGSLKGPQKISVQDLVPICSNCHRMIHRDKAKPLSIEVLRSMIRRKIKD
jgi:predicted HNH restriction endonuclease